ncbi:DnaD domain protein [Enterococcus sp. SMC-9]|uniref:DnaD domain protein n=1 Tax=Enterococcus sp. SMC-9 TaxID=2862343 RepID=UPI001E474E5F|nr:DnaD domain protein [Enterococcus sp. SMC-9]MCD1023499.1 DnaD domain protein [Enterococcus sp. SMC-9]
MADKGWIALHRSIRDHWLYQEKRVFSKYEAWLDILMDANHQDNKIVFDGQLIEIKRGQKVTSLRQLAERWGWSRHKVSDFLDLLERDAMLTRKSDTKKTLLTVINYDSYQNDRPQKGQQKGQQPSHARDTDVTQTDTNNNDNNVNNDNNINNVVVVGSDVPEVYKMYEQVFGILNPITIQNLQYWCNDLSPELVKEALIISAKGNANNFKYTESILKRWEKAGVKNLSDVAELNQKREQSSKSTKKSKQKIPSQTNSRVNY